MCATKLQPVAILSLFVAELIPGVLYTRCVYPEKRNFVCNQIWSLVHYADLQSKPAIIAVQALSSKTWIVSPSRGRLEAVSTTTIATRRPRSSVEHQYCCINWSVNNMVLFFLYEASPYSQKHSRKFPLVLTCLRFTRIIMHLFLHIWARLIVHLLQIECDVHTST